MIYRMGEMTGVIHLIVNRQELLYDLYALTQAFYPGIELDTCISSEEAKVDGIGAERCDVEHCDVAVTHECRESIEAREYAGRLQDTICGRKDSKRGGRFFGRWHGGCSGEKTRVQEAFL